MAELNEEQLLLLNNLMYFRGSDENASVEEIALRAIEVAENYDKDTIALSGGFESNPEQMVEIANAILKDPELCDLYVADSMHTDGVHASCFVDSSGNATVAIRGTGGTYEAWSDNVEGAYGTGTECQEAFGEFMSEIGERYDDITVTGHSKGGNLAQYATIIFGDEIDRCVSFDGQGFNDEFCREYASEIAENRHKIKSICGDEDYVNILLESVSGETVYLETTEGENSHSPYALWDRNQGTLDNGEYSETVEQSTLMKMVDDLAGVLEDSINLLPDDLEMSLVDFIGSCVGELFAVNTGQMSFEDWLDHIEKKMELDLMLEEHIPPRIMDLIRGPLEDLYNAFQEYVYDDKEDENKSRKRNSDKSYTRADGYFSIKNQSVTNILGQMKTCEKTVAQLSDDAGRVRLHGGNYDLLNKTIDYLEKELEEHSNTIGKLHSTLYSIQEKYQKTEKQICSETVF